MASRYVLQVVMVETGRVVASWPPGLAKEQDVVAALVEALVAGVREREQALVTAGVGVVAERERRMVGAVVAAVKEGGVGVFRTEAQVCAVVAGAVSAAVGGVCADVERALVGALQAGMRDEMERALVGALQAVKRQVVP